MKMKKEEAQEKEYVKNVGLRKLAERIASTNRGYRSSLYRQKRNTNGDERRSRHIYAFSIIGVIICSMLLVTMTGTVGALGTYYASPSGGGNGLSASSPFQIANFWSVAQPGDTLILLDGTYTGAASMIVPVVSGSLGSPITIEALNDGAAIIDGQDARTPIYVDSQDYITIEGVCTKQSSTTVVEVVGCTGVIFRRVSAYDAYPNTNRKQFALYSSSQCLLEDCAAGGLGRNCYMAFKCDNITFRRCWGQFYEYVEAPRYMIQIYSSEYCLMENCIGTNVEFEEDVGGIAVWGNPSNPNNPCLYNEIYGCVMYDFNYFGYCITGIQTTGNRIENSVTIGYPSNVGILVRTDDDMDIKQTTIVNSNEEANYAGYHPALPVIINQDIRNSVLLNGDYGIYEGDLGEGGSLTHSYNDIYGFNTNYGGGASEGTGEIHVDPGFNTATYGKGAYLIRPPALKGMGENGADMGAEVLYRYVDGVLTDDPLWPWPMEGRIFAETGVSPTWEANGGLWKTLDGVYEAASTGTISGTLTDKDTGNPIAGATVSANAYSSTTNSEGKYTLYNIPEGSYTVTASKAGYLTQSQTNVQVVGSQKTTVNLQLTEVPVSEPEPESDLVGEWHFDEGSGTTALDSSGNSNDGTLKNMDLATAWVEGKNGYAVAFDGTDDYIDCGNDDSLNINDALTIVAWVKPDVIADSQTIVYGGRTNYLLDLYSNNLRFHPDTRYAKSSSNTFTYSPGEWIHVSVTYSYSTGQGTFYKDGESIGSFTNTQTPASYGNFKIGYYNTNLKFNGAVDEVKIYSRALSAEEIQAAYEAGLEDEIPPATEGAVSGAIVHASDESGIAGVTVDLMQDGIVIASTVTDSNGDYLITDVPPGDYTLNASKIRFWSDATSVTVITDETVTEQCTLWLKGDLNNNGVAADEDDLAMMMDATVGKITPDWKYDLNENGISADAADQAMMIDAAVGKIILE
jgi:hypothetical protein